MFYILYGEIPKRLKGSVLKTERRLTTVRGFKSLFLRQIEVPPIRVAFLFGIVDLNPSGSE